MAASWNMVLIGLYGHLTDGLRERVRAVVDSPLPDPVRRQAPEHAAIVAAIEARDEDTAERAAGLCLHRAVAALEATAGACGPETQSKGM